MVEIFNALVEILSKAVPALTGARRTKRLNTIGTDLFVIYFRLNEVLVTAEQIVSSLETYVERMGRHLASGGDPYALTAGSWIRELLERQSVNLTRLCDLLASHDMRLVLIDADAYTKLAPLIDRKSGAIRGLLKAIDGQRLPASPSADDVRFILATDDFWSRDRRYDHIIDHLRHDGIPLDRPWGEETYQTVVAYLRERDPKAQLAEIAAGVERLRAALLEHFSVEDLLLAVGDERFGR